MSVCTVASRDLPRSFLGWMRGDISLDDNNLLTICVELQLTIVNVEYRSVLSAPRNTHNRMNMCFLDVG